MAQVGFQFGPQQLTYAEAEAAALDGTFPYPVPLIRAIQAQHTRQDEFPSASVITGCLRQFELKKTTPYYAKPTSSLASLFGTAFHTLVEEHTETGEGAHKELQLRADIDTDEGVVPLSGRVDYFEEGRLIRDWKSKGYIPVGFKPPKYHLGQVNIYNYLTAMSGYQPATHYELVYVSQSWIQVERGEMAQVSDMHRWLRGRLGEWLRHHKAGTLPPPVPEFFDKDAKGKALPPCAYCEVRDACMAAMKRESPNLEDWGLE